jgi:hypothetical protein
LFSASRWAIRSVHKFAGSSLPSGEPIGYEISRDGRTIGMVETINRGRVWLDPSLSEEEQGRLAAVATAVLLYEPTNGDS